jgi:hypothetical protein
MKKPTKAAVVGATSARASERWSKALQRWYRKRRDPHYARSPVLQADTCPSERSLAPEVLGVRLGDRS